MPKRKSSAPKRNPMLAKNLGKRPVYKCHWCLYQGTPHSVQTHEADSCEARLKAELRTGRIVRG